jgi:hypothetical protein
MEENQEPRIKSQDYKRHDCKTQEPGIKKEYSVFVLAPGSCYLDSISYRFNSYFAGTTFAFLNMVAPNGGILMLMEFSRPCQLTVSVLTGSVFSSPLPQNLLASELNISLHLPFEGTPTR